jgi:hypothetical protein
MYSRFGVQFPEGLRDFSCRQSTQSGSGAHPASHSIGTVIFSPDWSCRSPWIYLPIDRLRKNGARPLLPLRAFISWTRTTSLSCAEINIFSNNSQDINKLCLNDIFCLVARRAPIFVPDGDNKTLTQCSGFNGGVVPSHETWLKTKEIPQAFL